MMHHQSIHAVEEKECTSCLDDKPDNHEYFLSMPCCNNRDTCKECFNENVHAQSQTNGSHQVKCFNCDHEFTMSELRELGAPAEYVNEIERIQNYTPRMDHVSEEDLRAINEGTRPCPQCYIPIAKNAGCKHMKCNNCHHDFCWDCLEPWHTGRNYYRCSSQSNPRAIRERIANLRNEQVRMRNPHSSNAIRYQRWLNQRDIQKNIIIDSMIVGGTLIYMNRHILKDVYYKCTSGIKYMYHKYIVQKPQKKMKKASHKTTNKDDKKEHSKNKTASTKST
jgi:hypothetical protein